MKRYNFVIVGLFAVGLLAAMLYMGSKQSWFNPPMQWQEMRVNGVMVYFPKTHDFMGEVTFTATDGDEAVVEWTRSSTRLVVNQNHIWFNAQDFGECKPDGSVRLHPDGRVEIDSEFRQPRSEQ